MEKVPDSRSISKESTNREKLIFCKIQPPLRSASNKKYYRVYQQSSLGAENRFKDPKNTDLGNMVSDHFGANLGLPQPPPIRSRTPVVRRRFQGAKNSFNGSNNGLEGVYSYEGNKVVIDGVREHSRQNGGKRGLHGYTKSLQTQNYQDFGSEDLRGFGRKEMVSGHSRAHKSFDSTHLLGEEVLARLKSPRNDSLGSFGWGGQRAENLRKQAKKGVYGGRVGVRRENRGLRGGNQPKYGVENLDPNLDFYGRGACQSSKERLEIAGNEQQATNMVDYGRKSRKIPKPYMTNFGENRGLFRINEPIEGYLEHKTRPQRPKNIKYASLGEYLAKVENQKNGEKINKKLIKAQKNNTKTNNPPLQTLKNAQDAAKTSKNFPKKFQKFERENNSQDQNSVILVVDHCSQEENGDNHSRYESPEPGGTPESPVTLTEVKMSLKEKIQNLIVNQQIIDSQEVTERHTRVGSTERLRLDSGGDQILARDVVFVKNDEKPKNDQNGWFFGVRKEMMTSMDAREDFREEFSRLDAIFRSENPRNENFGKTEKMEDYGDDSGIGSDLGTDRNTLAHLVTEAVEQRPQNGQKRPECVQEPKTPKTEKSATKHLQRELRHLRKENFIWKLKFSALTDQKELLASKTNQAAQTQKTPKNDPNSPNPASNALTYPQTPPKRDKTGKNSQKPKLTVKPNFNDKPKKTIKTSQKSTQTMRAIIESQPAFKEQFKQILSDNERLKNATKNQRYQQELTDLKAQLLNSERMVDSAIRQKKREIDSLRAKIEQYERIFEKEKKYKKEMIGRVQEFEELVEKLQKENTKLHDKISLQITEITTVKAKSGIESQRILGQVSGLEERVRVLEAENKQLSAMLASTRIETGKFHAAKSELFGAEERIKRLELENGKLAAALASRAEPSVASQSPRMVDLEATVEIEENLNSLKMELKLTNERLREKQEELDGIVDSFETKIGAINDEFEVKLGMADKANLELAGAKAQLEITLDNFRRSNSVLEARNQQMVDEIASAKHELKLKEISLIDKEKRIEDLRGDKQVLEDTVGELRDELFSHRERLEASEVKLGSFTSSAEKHEKSISELRGRNQELSNQVKSKSDELKTILETMLESKVMIERISAENVNLKKSAKSKDKELEQLRKEISGVKSGYEKLQTSLCGFESQKTAEKQKVENYKTLLKEKDTTIRRFESDFNSYRERFETKGREAERLEAENRRLKAEVKKLSESVSGLDLKVFELESDRELKESELGRIRADFDALGEKFDLKKNELEELRIELKSKNKRIGGLEDDQEANRGLKLEFEAEIEKLKNDLSGSENELNLLKSDLNAKENLLSSRNLDCERYASRIAQLEKQQKEAEIAQNLLKRANSDLQRDNEALLADLNALRSKQIATAKNEEDVTTQAEKLKIEVNRLKMEISTLQAELKTLRDQTWSLEEQLSAEKARTDALEPKLQQAEHRLLTYKQKELHLKNRINNLEDKASRLKSALEDAKHKSTKLAAELELEGNSKDRLQKENLEIAEKLKNEKMRNFELKQNLRKRVFPGIEECYQKQQRLFMDFERRVGAVEMKVGSLGGLVKSGRFLGVLKGLVGFRKKAKELEQALGVVRGDLEAKNGQNLNLSNVFEHGGPL